MRTSTDRTPGYRQTGSRHDERRANFRQQMADFARAEEVLRLREGASLSQEELAHKVGVSTKTVRSWEKGGGIRPANARALGRYFKIKPALLVHHEIDAEQTNGASPEPEAVAPDLADVVNRLVAIQFQLETAQAAQTEMLRRLDALGGSAGQRASGAK